MDVKFTDNSDKVLSDLEKAIKRGLEAIGMTGEEYAKRDPNMPVDTGRARNSITWATKENEGKSFSYSDKKGNKFLDQRGTGADDRSVYLGSNVDYFPPIELGGRNISARHVLQRAVTEHPDEYKALIKESLENA